MRAAEAHRAALWAELQGRGFLRRSQELPPRPRRQGAKQKGTIRLLSASGNGTARGRGAGSRSPAPPGRHGQVGGGGAPPRAPVSRTRSRERPGRRAEAERWGPLPGPQGGAVWRRNREGPALGVPPHVAPTWRRPEHGWLGPQPSRCPCGPRARCMEGPSPRNPAGKPSGTPHRAQAWSPLLRACSSATGSQLQPGLGRLQPRTIPWVRGRGSRSGEVAGHQSVSG